MSNATPFPLVLIIFEAGCWLAGIVLFWRLVTRRLDSGVPALAPWRVSLEGFITAALMVAAGGWLFPQIPGYLSDEFLGPAANGGPWLLLVQGAAFQLGLLGGALVAGLYIRRLIERAPAFTTLETNVREAAAPTQPEPRPILAGTITFLISIPLISGLGFAWKTLLELVHFPTGEQEMIDLFRNADDPALLACMIVLAAVVAPVTEELIFRAGLFRYLRTRVSRVFSLAIPAMIFALLHGNVAAFLPLFALGVFFALAYERTGRIAVPMIAHSLFNLHTIVLVMAGVTTD